MKAVTRLHVEQIPGEPGRFFVESSSRPDVRHVVDMCYQESPKDKPRAVCGCESMQARGAKTCKHVEAVILHAQKQNQPDYTTKDFEPFPL